MEKNHDSEKPPTHNERFTRYSGLIDPEVIRSKPIIILGCGAIGAALARQLAAMGFEFFVLYDDDVVSAENLGTQGWRPAQLGLQKVEALRSDIAGINPQVTGFDAERRADAVDMRELMEVAEHQRAFVFMCVDSMDARKEITTGIWESPHDNICVFDARMGLSTLRAFCLHSDESWAHWQESWFPAAEAHQGQCTMQSTYYTASMAASVLSALAIQQLIGGILPHEVQCNLSSFDMVTKY